MLRSAALLCAALLLARPAGALLQDPSFELASDGTTTSNSAWSLVANAPDGANPSATFTDGPFAASDGEIGVWFRSFEGAQEAGDALADATLSQTVAGVAGGDYALTFQAAREANFTAGTWQATLRSSGTGGSSSVDLLTAVFNDALNMDDNPTTFALQIFGVSPGDDVTVEVVMLDGELADVNPQSAFVDNFQLVRRAPEPGTLALLAVALASGALGRMRRGPPLHP